MQIKPDKIVLDYADGTQVLDVAICPGRQGHVLGAHLHSRGVFPHYVLLQQVAIYELQL